MTEISQEIASNQAERQVLFESTLFLSLQTMNSKEQVMDKKKHMEPHHLKMMFRENILTIE